MAIQTSKFLPWLGSFFKKFTITAADGSPYLTRYYILKTRWLKVYLHQFHRSDEDRDMHDHPWNFMSIVLKSGYVEHLPESIKLRKPGAIIRHCAEDRHFVKLLPQCRSPECISPEVEAWTLVFVGKKRREWGFHTQDGWLHWREYLNRKFGPGNYQEEPDMET